VHTALESIGERPLPAPAGVNLGFHDNIDIAQFTRDSLGFIPFGGHFSAGRGYAELLQEFFRLILVNVHRLAVAQAVQLARDARRGNVFHPLFATLAVISCKLRTSILRF
jgi:hypothetical protein